VEQLFFDGTQEYFVLVRFVRNDFCFCCSQKTAQKRYSLNIDSLCSRPWWLLRGILARLYRICYPIFNRKWKFYFTKRAEGFVASSVN
jgi:hypothetical protein